MKRAIALTGSIATGKSSVATFLKLFGYEVIDADEIAHQLLDKHKKEIERLFGKEIVEKDGVNRRKLGDIVFNNPREREKLEKFLHPKIRKVIFSLSENLDKKGVNYFIEIPLFFETKAYPIKRIVVVYAPKEIQIKRLTQNNGLSTQEALKRIEAQLYIEYKKKLADFVIDNSKDLKHLQKEVEKFLRKLER